MKTKKVPINEIRFAAKTGFLKRKTWERYFSKRSRPQNIQVWKSFVTEKYFRPHGAERMEDILVLAPKGIQLAKTWGGETVSPPHINNIFHDTQVSEILLNLENSKIATKIETEGELRIRYMGWLKRTREGREAKLPDLLIEIPGTDKSMTLALEIELSRKNPERYRKVMNSYAAQKSAQRIVFISDQKNIFDRLSRAMKDTHYPSWEKPIGFSALNEWLTDPVNAVIYFSDHSTTLKQLNEHELKIAA